MTFSDKKPSSPGWYLWKLSEHSDESERVQITEENGVLMFSKHNVHRGYLDDLGGYFSERLTPEQLAKSHP